MPLVRRSLQSAAGTASAVSRLLRKHGFLMADTSDRYHWTEGWHVHRIGYGSTVSVDYNFPRYSQFTREDKREKRKIGFEFLAQHGYPINDIGHIECETE